MSYLAGLRREGVVLTSIMLGWLYSSAVFLLDTAVALTPHYAHGYSRLLWSLCARIVSAVYSVSPRRSTSAWKKPSEATLDPMISYSRSDLQTMYWPT
ncbi:hypothetical protein BDQ17DRAFT_148192 [Cyathus striatus]|nr:hypothetical protein BDQ17DRAFT_148192 [Cyathus striatus]